MGTFTENDKSKASKQEDASKTKQAPVAEGQDKATTTALKEGEKLPDQKDAPVDLKAEEAEAQQKEIPADNPNEPTVILDETEAEKADRLIASNELGVADVTDEESQAVDGPFFESIEGLKVPGAASGPDIAGVVRNDQGNVAFAPAGTLNAAMNGVQQDASGHVDSIHTEPHSNKSGVRV